jgi:5'-AMP-activated protein kinase catalytic alpha subunit
MEHADSGEMFDYIVANHRIREHEAVLLFQQLVDGLEYLHANDITHRDLKPENLLLQSNATIGCGYLIKIVDFGLSNTHENGRLLRTACGSPCYAAPEMIEGKMVYIADILYLYDKI